MTQSVIVGVVVFYAIVLTHPVSSFIIRHIRRMF
jgi:hypothetical protein